MTVALWSTRRCLRSTAHTRTGIRCNKYEIDRATTLNGKTLLDFSRARTTALAESRSIAPRSARSSPCRDDRCDCISSDSGPLTSAYWLSSQAMASGKRLVHSSRASCSCESCCGMLISSSGTRSSSERHGCETPATGSTKARQCCRDSVVSAAAPSRCRRAGARFRLSFVCFQPLLRRRLTLSIACRSVLALALRNMAVAMSELGVQCGRAQGRCSH